MKIKVDVNGVETEITLTEKQVEHIKKSSQKVTDRIKSFEDACADQGLDPEDVLPYSEDTEDPEEININAYVKLKTIFKSLNEGWVCDWSDSSQYKYYPWLKSNGSGLGLSYDGCVFDASYTLVGSRLVLKSSELAEYAGKQFIEIYNQYNN